MSSVTGNPFNSQLPWASSDRENKRFNQITAVALVLTLLLALWVKWQEVPERTREEKERIPPQLTRIIEAQKIEPPKPIEAPKPIPEPEPEVEPPKPEPEPEKKVEPPQEKPKPVEKAPTQVELAEKAREKAKQSGLLAFQDDLASMREQPEINNLADTQQIQGAGQAEQTQRSFVGKTVDQKSGGLDTSRLTSDVGAKGSLAGRKTTEFTAPNEGLASLAAKELAEEDAVIGSRDIESIRKGFDANKGAIYSVYRRALRTDASLQGKVTINLEIAPDGSVSKITLVSSELNYPELEEKLLARIRLINFGAQTVTATSLDYSFNFLPY